MAFCVLLIFGGDLNEMMRLFLFIQNLTDTLWCEGRRSLRWRTGVNGWLCERQQPAIILDCRRVSPRRKSYGVAQHTVADYENEQLVRGAHTLPIA
jgi:hypothetical protein